MLSSGLKSGIRKRQIGVQPIDKKFKANPYLFVAEIYLLSCNSYLPRNPSAPPVGDQWSQHFAQVILGNNGCKKGTAIAIVHF